MTESNATNAKKRVSNKNSQKKREFMRWFPWILFSIAGTLLLAALLGWHPIVVAPAATQAAAVENKTVGIAVTGGGEVGFTPSNGLPTATLEAEAPEFIPETGTGEEAPRQNDTTAMNISSWLGANDWGMLPPGMSTIGDVSVNDRIYYDSGSGEATLVINNSSSELKITANWGSSLINSVDENALVEEIWRTGCDINNGGCSRTRVVTCTDAGCTEVFKDRPTVTP